MLFLIVLALSLAFIVVGALIDSRTTRPHSPRPTCIITSPNQWPHPWF